VWKSSSTWILNCRLNNLKIFWLCVISLLSSHIPFIEANNRCNRTNSLYFLWQSQTIMAVPNKAERDVVSWLLDCAIHYSSKTKRKCHSCQPSQINSSVGPPRDFVFGRVAHCPPQRSRLRNLLNYSSDMANWIRRQVLYKSLIPPRLETNSALAVVRVHLHKQTIRHEYAWSGEGAAAKGCGGMRGNFQQAVFPTK
jgi:hypothetical protein